MIELAKHDQGSTPQMIASRGPSPLAATTSQVMVVMSQPANIALTKAVSNEYSILCCASSTISRAGSTDKTPGLVIRSAKTRPPIRLNSRLTLHNENSCRMRAASFQNRAYRQKEVFGKELALAD